MFPERTVAYGEPMLEQIFLMTTAASGGPSLEQNEGLQPVESTGTGTGEQHAEEGAAERSCYGVTATPHSTLSWATQARVR